MQAQRTHAATLTVDVFTCYYHGQWTAHISRMPSITNCAGHDHSSSLQILLHAATQAIKCTGQCTLERFQKEEQPETPPSELEGLLT